MKTEMAALTLALAVISGAAYAQSSATPSTPRIDQRQANQQQRIDQGVKSGSLTEREAARLEKGQQRIDRMENRAMADGKMTRQERRRIEQAQDRQSTQIYRESHDRQSKVAQNTTPSSTSRIDRRQAEQQKRIDAGVKSGSLNAKEAARLEKGQQKVQRMENRAMADGTVTAKERQRIEHAQNQQSRKIYREKHDRQHK